MKINMRVTIYNFLYVYNMDINNVVYNYILYNVLLTQLSIYNILAMLNYKLIACRSLSYITFSGIVAT